MLLLIESDLPQLSATEHGSDWVRAHRLLGPSGSYTRLVSELRFEMVISHVFNVAGRPVIVSGACSPTELRQGDMVEVLRNGNVVVTTRAFVDLHSRPGTASLVLTDVTESDVEPGYVLRATGQH